MSDSLFIKLTEQQIDTVNKQISQQIDSPVEYLNQVCFHLIDAGGKRIRPRLMLLCAGLVNGKQIQHEELDEKIYSLAASVEILHTATLMHDDVIDEGLMRRGRLSVNNAFGNRVAVLGGDYLFTKAYNTSIKINNPQISRLFSNTLATLVEGELTQMSNIANTGISEETYFKTIYSKTSALFEITSKIPGFIYNCTDEQIEHLALYGRNIGYVFQIADDILDYTADSKTLGKIAGKDMEEFKITLPVIYTIKNNCGISGEDVYKAVNSKDIVTLKEMINRTGAISRCDDVANRLIAEAVHALDAFPDSEYRDALEELANAAYRRRN
ncbi:MAG: polyprenyl synthetase family protein [Ruminobacter sp.]|nr:polyprenyl synthetase family protein [Ruminobacter sp.]